MQANLSEQQFLKQAVDLAEANAVSGGRPFGAVVTLNGKIIAEGVNTTESTQDPTDHAEVVAIRGACANLNSLIIPGTVIYASAQPCVMCQSLAFASGVSEMVFALSAAECAELGWTFNPATFDLLAAVRTTLPTLTRHLEIPGAQKPFEVWTEMQRHSGQ